MPPRCSPLRLVGALGQLYQPRPPEVRTAAAPPLGPRDNPAMAATRYFTLAEAEELLPIVRAAMDQLGSLHAKLRAEIALHPVAAHTDGFRSAAAYRLNEDMHRVVRWFQGTGIQIKGLSPALVDFPALVGDREVLLCWRTGEEHVAWYHDPDAGFAGRRPVSELDV